MCFRGADIVPTDWSRKAFFRIFRADDPTHGFNNYDNNNNYDKLVTVDPISNHIFVGAAGSNPAAEAGMPAPDPNVAVVESPRFYSRETFSGGVFSLELFHMPAATAGTGGIWPTVWFTQCVGQFLPNGQVG